MKTSDLIARTQEVLGLESRAELEHVLTCTDCYLFDQIDCGPFWCLEFRKVFRGYVAPERTIGGYVPALWASELHRTLVRQLRFRG